MSQFNYVNDLTSALGMDSELTKGPAPRWQRKLENSLQQSVNNSINTSKLSISYNGYAAAAASSTTTSNRTPNKSGTQTQQGRKTPNSKSPGRKTPSKEGAKTPTGSGGDRFIPSRANSNFELGHYMIKQVCVGFAFVSLCSPPLSLLFNCPTLSSLPGNPEGAEPGEQRQREQHPGGLLVPAEQQPD